MQFCRSHFRGCQFQTIFLSIWSYTTERVGLTGGAHHLRPWLHDKAEDKNSTNKYANHRIMPNTNDYSKLKYIICIYIFTLLSISLDRGTDPNGTFLQVFVLKKRPLPRSRLQLSRLMVQECSRSLQGARKMTLTGTCFGHSFGDHAHMVWRINRVELINKRFLGYCDPSDQSTNR